MSSPLNSARRPTVEEHIAEWASQMPGLRASDAEVLFIADMRRAAAAGVGYGWMQQMIEVEWNHLADGRASGPSYFASRIAELEQHRKRWRDIAVRLYTRALAVVRYEWTLREKVPARQKEWTALVEALDELETLKGGAVVSKSGGRRG